jgi:N-acetylglucosaminyldiphosphoundecaprenol N-acetyl-beta-D-mannosaminyltransferase
MNTINIFDVHTLNITMQQALDLIAEAVQKADQRKMYFVNADCLNKAYLNDEYHKILNSTKYIFGDGSGVKMASQMVGNPIVDNVNGTDMLPLLCLQCVEKGHSLFLLGAKPGVAEAMKKNMENKFPGIKIKGTRNGYFDKEKENDSVVEQINNSKADILLVAFGAPFQEKWIHENAEKLHCKALIGVGGLFDFFSGNMPRAPLCMRKLGIEWVFRLYKEPGRMWRRYIIGNPLFIRRVKKWKKTGKRGSNQLI